MDTDPKDFPLGGGLPATWLPPGPDCAGVPEFQRHEYNDDFVIIRQSGCSHFEKPFLYLLFGTERALLLDTGAGKADVAGAVYGAIDSWLQRNRRTTVDLIVAHTHGHDDHIAGDSQFIGRTHTTFVPPRLEDVKKFFRFANWPEEIVPFDLGGRVLDVIPMPGHDDDSIAIYDRRTAVLLTGDTLYAGRLYVEDGPAFVQSVRRLVDFTRDKPVAHILGCHIENSRTPFVDYPAGTVYQPEEHSLELGRAHLLELDDALQRMNGPVTRQVLRDFTIWPV